MKYMSANRGWRKPCFHEGKQGCQTNVAPRRSYWYALMSCCLQAGYLLRVEQGGDAKGAELVLYNVVWTVHCTLVVSENCLSSPSKKT